jgi:hypothetical protein
MKLQVDEMTWHLTFLLAYPILENKQIYRENFAKRRNSKDPRDYRFAITFTVLSKVAESTSLSVHKTITRVAMYRKCLAMIMNGLLPDCEMLTSKT